jgi:hypothetical protein
MKQTTYRQGDVLLVKTRSTERKSLVAATKGSRVLAYGEVTGHKHVLSGDRAEFYDNQGTVLVNLPVGGELVHEEHSAIQLPKGTYKVVLQREHDLVQGVRAVMD